MTAPSTTATLCGLGVLSHLDHELAETLLELAGEASPEVALGAAFASWAVQRGHVCAELAELGTRVFTDEEDKPLEGIVLPELESWLAALRSSKLVALDTPSAEAPRPLVLSGSRLYLARYFEYERALAEALLERSKVVHAELDGALLQKGLDALFPVSKPGMEGQRRACLLAALRGLSVISGGPGTGKTYTVAKVLLLLQQQELEHGRKPHRIQLLAPTGKAAQRLGEAIQQNLADIPAALRPHIPAEASTIHRALGYQQRAPTRFRHNRDNPLPADIVVVDEASMVDLALMAKLVDAVHPRARLVLLGDKDQLASVEAGAILGDIYGGNPDDGYSREMAGVVKRLTGDALPVSPSLPLSGAQDCMVHLTYVHRFEGGGAIAKLATAVRNGRAEEAFEVLDGSGAEVELCPVEPGAELEAVFGELVLDRFARLGTAPVDEKLKILSSFRFLCAHRQGNFGVHALNAFVAEHLTRHGKLQGRGDWYDGRPILITSNDYALELFNGDVGVIARDPEAPVSDGESPPLVAFFPGSKSATPRRFPPGQLPPHDTVFAMSVHKAQGSELDEVALVLPERVSPILTRELIYTGITRAKRKVQLFGTKPVLEHAIRARVQRASGLGERVWGQRG
ncbi:MAG: exodeoxyribonuclease V subunit alpha [Polyangiaceae bacterium]|nr:exodeoxyribonuclease V subunit alpha [Polyangiaceae bacterium]MCL4755901.1 exodeoxyribonuclease V subunit alpha [Myxococcales bacterium]